MNLLERYRVIERPVKEVLASFTYKPGWDFRTYDGHLIITILALNTDNIKETINVNFMSTIPDFEMICYSPQRWLFDRIMEVERHEAQEFFKINGVKVFDPHG